MALGYLKIFFIVMIITAVVLQILLYSSNNKSNNLVFILNMLLGVFISFMVYTALPSNASGQKLAAASWGLMAILAFIIRLTTNKSSIISKVVITVAILGGLGQLIL